ncbi:unnamed protein product [Chrysoparadoxa australica]
MTVLDALYFCVATLTTVGYGDLTPTSPWLKLFTCAFIIAGVAVVASLLAFVFEVILMREEMTAALSKDQEPTLLGNIVSSSPIFKSELARSLGLLLVVFCGGVVCISVAQGLPLIDGIYFIVVSAATVGYGDLTVTTTFGKLFAITYLPLATICVVKVCGDWAGAQVQETIAKVKQRVICGMDLDTMKELDVDDNKQLDQFEYVTGTLLASGALEEADLKAALAKFKELDDDNTGYLAIGSPAASG